jgi:hypothetical protein
VVQQFRHDLRSRGLEGDQPATGKVTGETFRQMYEQYADTKDSPPPIPRIHDFVQALLAGGAISTAGTVTPVHGSARHCLVCYDPELDQLRTPLIDTVEIDQLIRDGHNIQAIAKLREQLDRPLRLAVDLLDQRSRQLADRATDRKKEPRRDRPAFVLTGGGRKIANPRSRSSTACSPG